MVRPWTFGMGLALGDGLAHWATLSGLVLDALEDQGFRSSTPGYSWGIPLGSTRERWVGDRMSVLLVRRGAS